VQEFPASGGEHSRRAARDDRSAARSPMLRIRPAPAPRTEVSIRTRRPPLAYVELLSEPEEDFRRIVEEVEKDPLFRELSARGLVKRRGGRGRMPREAYEARLDRDVAAFVRRYRIDRRADGLKGLQDALSKHGVEVVAGRLGAPVAEVERVARFLTERSLEGGRRAPRPDEQKPADLDDYVAGAPSVDIEQATAIVRDFVHRFGLKHHQLVADFLHGDQTPLELSRKYHTTEEVIRRVVDAVTFVLTTDIVAAVPPPAARRRTARERPTPVARVSLRDGEPQLQFGDEAGYALRYVIDASALGEVEGGGKRQEAEELLRLLRHINQRRSVLCRVVAALFERQSRYFASGDEVDLVPASQADLARELKEHQSTISRSVRDRYLETPYGVHELQFYCQRKQDVVLRLAQAHPEASDRELQDILRERYGCRIARRTVAYHRRGQER
jgi:Sigma-54, DNA binding domain